MVAMPERPWRIRPIELNRLNRPLLGSLVGSLVREGSRIGGGGSAARPPFPF